MEDLLIVSNADLIWVKRYVENVVIPLGLSVKIVSTYNIKYSQFYKECGIDVDDIQFWLGHKNVANTFIYLEYTPILRNQLFERLQLLEKDS